jgi:hypothetical protein
MAPMGETLAARPCSRRKDLHRARKPPSIAYERRQPPCTRRSSVAAEHDVPRASGILGSVEAGTCAPGVVDEWATRYRYPPVFIRPHPLHLHGGDAYKGNVRKAFGNPFAAMRSDAVDCMQGYVGDLILFFTFNRRFWD